jgi:hypothetical protein
MDDRAFIRPPCELSVHFAFVFDATKVCILRLPITETIEKKIIANLFLTRMSRETLPDYFPHSFLLIWYRLAVFVTPRKVLIFFLVFQSGNVCSGMREVVGAANYRGGNEARPTRSRALRKGKFYF